MPARRAAIELTNFLSLRGLKDIGRFHPIFNVLSSDVRRDKKPSAFNYLNPDKLVEYT